MKLNEKCYSCVYELNPKEPKHSVLKNPCVKCLYNEQMVKTNNYKAKKAVA